MRLHKNRFKISSIVKAIIIMSSIFMLYRLYIKPAQLFTSNIPSIPILMYHHIVEDESEVNLITLTLTRFEQDIAYLKKKKYTPISFKDLIDFKEGKSKLPKKPIIITFDDGYYNNYKHAYPVLVRENVKATIFVIGARLGVTSYNNDPRYTYFAWKDAKEMYQSNLIEIQPHTYNLHFYKENNDHGHGVLAIADETEQHHYDRFALDTQKVIQCIKTNTGSDSYVFSYPYGDYNSTNETLLKNMGFKVSTTTKNDFADITTDLYKLKRINVPSDKTLAELLVKR